MRQSNSFPALIFFAIFGVGAGLAFLLYKITDSPDCAWLGAVAFVIAIGVSLAIKVANQWERVVVLRLGKFRSLEGPGLFFIVPIIDTTPFRIDTRVITSAFKAEN